MLVFGGVNERKQILEIHPFSTGCHDYGRFPVTQGDSLVNFFGCSHYLKNATKTSPNSKNSVKLHVVNFPEV